MTVVEAATAVVLLAVLSGKGMLHEMLSAPRLVMVGKLSYGVYLWHYPVVRYLRADWHWSITVAVGLLISLALSALSFYTLERWAMRRREHVAPTPAAQPTYAGSALGRALLTARKARAARAQSAYQAPLLGLHSAHAR